MSTYPTTRNSTIKPSSSKKSLSKTPLTNQKKKLNKELTDLECFAESEREALLKLIKEKHQKHKEEVKKLKELKKIELKTDQQKINFLLEQKDSTSKAYLMRRVQSAKYKSKYETEKIKNKILKVDETLKKLDFQDKIDELRKKAEDEVNEENKKAKINPAQLCEMVNRLYRLNPKDEVERELNKRKIEERKNERKKQMEIRKIEVINMHKNQKVNDNDENLIEDENKYENDLGELGSGYNRTNIKDKMRKILNSPKKNVISSKKFPLIKNTEKHSYKNPVKIKAFMNVNTIENENNKKDFSLRLPSATGKNSSSTLKKNTNRYNSENIDQADQTEDQSSLHNLRYKNENETTVKDKARKRPKSAGYRSAFPSENISAPDLHAVKNEIIAIKKNGFKLEDIEKFKRKYKNVDISSLMHQAKIKCIKKTSKNKNDFYYLNKGTNKNSNLNNYGEEDLDENEELEKLKEIRKKINIEKRLYNQAKAKLEEQESEFLAAEESENEENEGDSGWQNDKEDQENNDNQYGNQMDFNEETQNHGNLNFDKNANDNIDNEYLNEEKINEDNLNTQNNEDNKNEDFNNEEENYEDFNPQIIKCNK